MERGATINNYEKTNKSIIKNNGSKEKINRTKTEINSRQIEESQKKNVNTELSSKECKYRIIIGKGNKKQ